MTGVGLFADMSGRLKGPFYLVLIRVLQCVLSQYSLFEFTYIFPQLIFMKTEKNGPTWEAIQKTKRDVFLELGFKFWGQSTFMGVCGTEEKFDLSHTDVIMWPHINSLRCRNTRERKFVTMAKVFHTLKTHSLPVWFQTIFFPSTSLTYMSADRCMNCGKGTRSRM